MKKNEKKTGLISFLHIQSGISLLEVLIFTSLLTIVFLGITSATTISLKQTQYAKNQILATRNAEGLEEWMRGEKETDWAAFVARSASAPGNTYCFNNQTLSWPSAGACTSTDYSLNLLYKREATLSGTGGQVTISIRVYWLERGNTYSVPLDTVLSLWE